MLSNIWPIEKVLSLLSTQLFHKASRSDTDNLRQQQIMMKMMMMSFMASILNRGVVQTTTSTASAEPIHGIDVELWGTSNNHPHCQC